MRRIGQRISRLFGRSTSSTKGDQSPRPASFSSHGTPSQSGDAATGNGAAPTGRLGGPIPTISITGRSSGSLRSQPPRSRASSVAHTPTPENEIRARASLGTQCALSLAHVVAEIAPVPCIGPLVEHLTLVFQAVERSRVNKDQWKLLRGRCVMVIRIAGAQVTNHGYQHYPGLEEAANLLEETLNKIQERAQYYNKMNEIVAFLLHQTISDEIQSLFSDLDSCLGLFSYATDVAQAQWVNEFRVVHERESRDLRRLKNELEKLNMNVDVIGQNSEQILAKTNKMVDALQEVLDDKSSALRSQSTTTVAKYVDAEQLVRTILSVTRLQLPPKLLLGRECIPDTGIPAKPGITCDIYLSSFLGGEKVAKKVFRIGISDKDHVENDYILPFYGIGMESFKSVENANEHFHLYMVSPLMNNSDAMTYLHKYRNSIGAKRSILRIVTDAAMGLKYLHNRRPPVVHSGMKGENILITDSGGAVLGGFGLTKALESVENSKLPPAVMTGRIESQRWLAPEMFEDDHPLETPCDVWGWAMATLEVVSGSIPYYMHQQAMTIMFKVNEGPPRRKDYPGFNTYAYRPDEMWALLEKCWAKEAKCRPTIDEIVVRLEEIAAMTEWCA